MFLHGYKFVHNSRGNSRGVAILIENNLSFTIHNEVRDQEGHYLLLEMSMGDRHFVLGVVYGPKTNNETTYIFKPGLIFRKITKQHNNPGCVLERHT
jgi:exonuclease III